MDDELKGMLGRILTVVEATRGDVKALDTRVGTLETRFDSLETKFGTLNAKVDSLDAKVEHLQSGQTELQVGQAELQSDVAEIRRVVGGNYLKLHGRIDQLSDMFMDHVNRYHGPGDSRRV